MPLSHDEEIRYSRHLILPGVGLAGQERLRTARVLIVGVGGLGSPVALYLAAAGVGHLGLMDADTVDLTNLQRQIIYRSADAGHAKAAAAAAAVRALNPHVDVTAYPVRCTAANAGDLLPAYDVVVDGTDNFPTRYLLNDACVLLGKPLVFGSIYRFEGQVSVFDARRGPCYRCLFPTPPETIPSCAEGGVLGVLPGLVGTLQATEVLKLLLGIGEPLIGRVLRIAALDGCLREFRLPRDPACPVCGDAPTITTLDDPALACAWSRGGTDEWELPADAVAARQAANPPTFIDVREAEECDRMAGLPGALHLPYPSFARRMAELDSAHDLVVYCSTGVRSWVAVGMLRRAGFTRAWSLHGGLAAWQALRLAPPGGG
jgi:molybdopterin/thiamine biosynthesis adenylyltransferase/rhodanese-related sulfurtransferase